MWPWGHLAVGYLVYSGFRYLGSDSPPPGPAALAVAVGTQVPDLVDKPLAWTLQILPNGRSLAHSLLVAALLLGILTFILDRFDRRSLATAFGIGYLAHIGSDALYPLLFGRFEELGFLLWPLVDPVEYDVPGSIIGHLLALELSPTVYFEFGLTVVAFVVWIRQGRPGLDVLGRRITQVVIRIR